MSRRNRFYANMLFFFSLIKMAAVGFEPTPLRTSALSWRLRPLGHATSERLTTSFKYKKNLRVVSILIVIPVGLEPTIFGSEDQRLIH